MESYMDLKVVCQKKEANEKNALGPFIHCRGKTPGTNRLSVVYGKMHTPSIFESIILKVNSWTFLKSILVRVFWCGRE